MRFECFAALAITTIYLLSISSLSSGTLNRKGGFRGGEVDSSPMATLGGVEESNLSAQNSNEIENLARFAVEEHNKKENAMLEFARVVKAKEQVVAGTLHHLTLEATDAGKMKLYEAKVWVKPWLNFKELQEFKHTDGTPSGWQTVEGEDPVVQGAANHAVKTIQQRSNSLFPYELREIVQAKAEVVDEIAKFDMLLRVQRGDKEEKFKVEVHRKNDGAYHLNQMEPATHS